MPTSLLRVELETEEDFRREYAENIANGGIFVSSGDYFEVRDLVRVELVLAYCGQSFEFDAEVVHCVPSETAGAGATPGVALQLHEDLEELRAKLEPLVGAVAERSHSSGTRASLRAPARLPIQLRLSDGSWAAGRTRNLSSSGALLALPGPSPPVGSAVALIVRHPESDEELAVDATVVRHVQSDQNEVAALGIEFDLPESQQATVREFVSRVASAEHARRLACIAGPIDEIGVESLLTMFASAARRGTLTLTRGALEGSVVFESKLFRAAELADSVGLEALAALLTWRSGRFEFETSVAPDLPAQAPVPLDVALWEATQGAATPARVPQEAVTSAATVDVAEAEPADACVELCDLATDDDNLVPDDGDGVSWDGDGVPDDEDLGLDLALDLDFGRESQRGVTAAEETNPLDVSAIQKDFSRLSPTATLSVDQAAVDAAHGELGKIEEALVDLASVGMTVAKAVDVIPEPDDDVYRALAGLADRGLVRLDA